MAKAELALPAELQEMLAISRKSIQDPGVAVNHPEYVTRCVVMDAIVMFVHLAVRWPSRIYVPKALEVSLQIDFARSLGEKGSIRVRHKSKLFGCQPVWDASEFKLE